MRVMTKKIGFNEMINDRAGVLRCTSGCFKELIADLALGFRLKCRHGGCSPLKMGRGCTRSKTVTCLRLYKIAAGSYALCSK
jgi:hypothetical protein